MTIRIIKNFERHMAERMLFWWQEDPGSSPSPATVSCVPVQAIPALVGRSVAPICKMMGLDWTNCFQTLFCDALEIHWVCNEKGVQEGVDPPPPAWNTATLLLFLSWDWGFLCSKRGFCYCHFFFKRLKNLSISSLSSFHLFSGWQHKLWNSIHPDFNDDSAVNYLS